VTAERGEETHTISEGHLSDDHMHRMYEAVIRMDERLKTVVEAFELHLRETQTMERDIAENRERSLDNKANVDRHEALINWALRVVVGAVIAAVLVAAGITSTVP